MTQKEYKRAANSRNLEATQIISLDDFRELEQLQLARTAAAGPAKQRRAVMAAGIFLGLALAAVLLAIVTRSGAH